MDLSELKKHCKVYDEEIIFHLSLTSQKLLKIDILSKCINLITLDLSNNNIDDLSPLSALPKLKKLNVSNNRIRKLHTLVNCEQLQHINLENNEISSFMQISHLSSKRNFPSLMHVSFKNNPICIDQSYSQKIFDLFLKKNNHKIISIDNRRIICDGTQRSIDDLVYEWNKKKETKEREQNRTDTAWIKEADLLNKDDNIQTMDATKDLQFQMIKKKLFSHIQTTKNEISKMDIAYTKIKKSI